MAVSQTRPRPESVKVSRAREILRGRAVSSREVLQLAKELTKEKAFSLARRLLAQARQDPAVQGDSALLRAIIQQQALCTSHDLELPADVRLDLAFQILQQSGDDLQSSIDPETLGIAGSICKSRWEIDGQVQHLERSRAYFLRGCQEGVTGDYGYCAINAALVLDILADLESVAAERSGAVSATAVQREQEARRLRETLIAELPELAKTKEHQGLIQDWGFLATVAEAYFGLGRYEEASQWLQTAMALPKIPAWQYESTIRRLIRLVQLHGGQSTDREIIAGHPAAEMLMQLFAVSPEALRGILTGKIGLALSGGGFRASLFHIGVLAKLAEFDILRHVEVLSCVSGGSIVGAYYYLEVRHLLKTKKDSEITCQDYIDIVKRLEKNFLAGVQRNIRTRVAADWYSNLKMIYKPNYSRTERVGELYEEEIYRLVEDGEAAAPRWLNELLVEPAGHPEAFSPRQDNWRRAAKVPILILNAATLNTGHNWQFTASWMGEPPAGVSSEVDGNDRLRRFYYDQAPVPHQSIRLGHAVAASSCVPGLFEPLALDRLYPDRIVRLVDGGVHDNQGIAGLLGEDCDIMLISDASGQMESQNYPKSGMVSVPLRSSSILQSRVREAQYLDVDSRRRSSQIRAFMFVHLKKDLNVKPIDWIGCNDPHDPGDEPLSAVIPGDVTSYGLPKDVQQKLAAIRTDLDSFNDQEAYALMTSGYLMTDHEFPKYIKGFSLQGPPPDWGFLAIEPALKNVPGKEAEHRKLMNILEAAHSSAFKIWKLKPILQAAAVGLAAIGLALFYWICSKWWNSALFTVGSTATVLITAILTSIVGPIVVKAINYRKTLAQVGVGLGMALIGFAAARLHLHYFDRWYLQEGRMSDET